MGDHDNPKRRRLREAGLLHPQPGQVRERCFQELPEFFDARDLLQVRYELLRAHRVGGEAVLALCKRYGISAILSEHEIRLPCHCPRKP